MTPEQRHALDRVVNCFEDILEAVADANITISRAIVVAKKHGVPCDLPDVFGKAEKARDALMQLEAITQQPEEAVNE